MANQNNSLSHTKWLCKYHIVIISKYKRKVIYNQYRKDLQEIIKILCKYKDVENIEGHMMPDHVHPVSYTHLDVYKRQAYSRRRRKVIRMFSKFKRIFRRKKKITKKNLIKRNKRWPVLSKTIMNSMEPAMTSTILMYIIRMYSKELKTRNILTQIIPVSYTHLDVYKRQQDTLLLNTLD